MNSRDAKSKILYSLNYFRSIQKRLNIDLREFGTCERVLGDIIDPLIPAQEADSQLIDTFNMILSNTNKAKQAMIDPDSINEQPSFNKNSSYSVANTRKSSMKINQERDHAYEIVDA